MSGSAPRDAPNVNSYQNAEGDGPVMVIADSKQVMRKQGIAKYARAEHGHT